MLEDCRAAKERWGGVSKIIDRWLSERQDMIVLYCSINGVEQLGSDKRSLIIKLKEFCQIMVDYVSVGHFEIYEQLNQEGFEFDDGGIEIAQALYPQIESNTHECLDFNDRCELISSVKGLQEALSALGEALEERFILEDKLIETLHESHRESVS
ncbi:MAG: sigma D regulator [Candidatus Endonucleobacter bathymodioli]|uniref:Sigma D regulator n=1 Tax=Candidatus Endonucleibacter bathymodioli TaxID=539814 RepID=A0AA90NMP0_9GAMM|nr:sigma D regulator [Candidatus Endonucleobacter bathymodioli]